MELKSARGLAEMLIADMTPHCQQVVIAGSIRREKSEVKDIEIVAVPRWEQTIDITDMFGAEGEPVNCLYTDWATRPFSGVRWIKPGTGEITDWQPKPAGKYWRGLLEGIKLDLFLATPENFGAILLIRTGAADFSQAVVTHGKRIGRPFVDGRLLIGGEPAETPTEESVFDLLHLQYIPPCERLGIEQVKGKR